MTDNKLNKRDVKRLLSEIVTAMNVSRDVKVELREYKNRIAITSLSSGVIRLNRSLLNRRWTMTKFGEDPEQAIRRILKHEVLHIKLGTKWHPPKYFKDLI